MGWIVPELLERCSQGSGVYFDGVAQIEMSGWSRGRVVLVGDACGCVSLLAGQGPQEYGICFNFSPDGSRIAYLSEEAEGPIRVFVVDASGSSEPVELTGEEGLDPARDHLDSEYEAPAGTPMASVSTAPRPSACGSSWRTAAASGGSRSGSTGSP
jgi:hypothetical protein